ncbi:type IV pilin, partial [Candidatus Bathyarchaeota archaeon]|nr:type IV pilin [Candidatus Bathyarchaeota archaeon]
MRFLKNKKALSTVVTTLIILVVSVLLATVVTFYAINITTTRTQEESLHITKLHIWYNSTQSTSEAAFLITNVGGRDVVIDKITVRGQECPWNTVYYNITTDEITSDLTYKAFESLTDDGSITIGSTSYTINQGSTSYDLTLPSGRTMIVYIKNPDHISINDIGVTVGVTVFTSNAQYYKEANV